MAGVGKSAMARRIAHLTKRVAIDIDTAVVEAAGRPIPEIFAEDGEPRFREMESEQLARALASPRPVVIATGGGIVESPANREQLARHAHVVLLTASDDVLIERLRNSSNRRPLLDGDLEANLRALRERRDQLYLDVADLVVQVGVLDLAGTAAVVLAAITERWPDAVDTAPDAATPEEL